MNKEVFSMFMLYLIFVVAACLSLVIFAGVAVAMFAV